MATLTEKVALVTAASRGIGRAIALRLAQEGARLVVNYLRNEEKANEVVQTIKADGGQAIAVQADVSNVAEIRRLFQVTLEHFGRLDILVNNAGGGILASLLEATEEQFDAQMAFNAKSAFFAMQEAARHMTDGGRIINISATLTLYPVAGAALYGGGKRAMDYFTLVASKELGPRGITVNTVSPGGVATDIYLSSAPPEQRKAAQSSPLGRMGTPQDVADVVAFVASEQARWLTGQNLLVDGGAAH